MMRATLKSRIPAVIAGLPVAVGKPIKDGAERIAREAAANAPDRPPPYSGLPESIEAKSADFSFGSRSAFSGVSGGLGFGTPLKGSPITATGYGVFAAWYWNYLEFGTTNASPRPFMLPAAEAEMPSIVAEVQAVLKAL